MAKDRDLSDALVDQFQDLVGSLLGRHKSILDVITQLDEAQSRLNCAVAHAVTGCGCIHVEAGRQPLPADGSYRDIPTLATTHVLGRLCERDQEAIEGRMGQLLFYLSAAAEILDINLYDVLLTKYKQTRALGPFYLS